MFFSRCNILAALCLLIFGIAMPVYGQQIQQGQSKLYGPTMQAEQISKELTQKADLRQQYLEAGDQGTFMALHMSLDWTSRHVYQGTVLNSQPILAGQVEWHKDGSYIGVRSILDTTSNLKRRGRVAHHAKNHYSRDRKWRLQENRYYIGDALAIPDFMHCGLLIMDLSWTYTQFPTMSECNYGEIGLAFSLPELWTGNRWNLTPVLAFNRNYDDNNSWIMLAEYYTRRLTEALELEIFNELYWGDNSQLRDLTHGECDGDGIYSAVFGIALNWQFSETLAFSPYLRLSCHPDGRVRRAMKRDSLNGAHTVWGGISMKMEF